MLLYHGSDVAVREPKLLKIQRKLDFGKGFYTTTDLQQAILWAKRVADRSKKRECFVTVYSMDEAKCGNLKICRFEKPNEDWLRFVSANRKGEVVLDEWDVIYGPVANDQTIPVITLYLDGMYDEKEAIKRLLPQNLKDQWTFKTEKALCLLEYKEIICI